MTTPVEPHVPRRPDPGRLHPALFEPGPLDALDTAADDDLDTLVDQILGSKPRPIDWTRLTGPAADEARGALDAWVRWLVIRYTIDLREIPPCWAEHGDIFEELSALHLAHRAAYDPAGAPTGPADWHTMLANTRARLSLAVARTGCRVGQHRPSGPPEWARTNAWVCPTNGVSGVHL